MIKVKFLQDFQGKETNEAFYKKDQEAELNDFLADLLVKENRAVYVAHGTTNSENTPQFEEVPTVEIPPVESVHVSRKRGRQ